jgi:predicted transcriptional regulator
MFENSSEELASNKLLILYILDKIKMDLTNSQITQLIMETELMNYFSLQEFLSQLIESNFVQIYNESNKELYSLTTKGIQALEYFLGRIPQDIKDKIDIYTIQNKDQILNDTQVKSDFIKVSDNEFIVSLKVIENQTNLIDLNLNVSSNKQAKLICDNWKNNASHLYADIIQLLISAD